MIRSLPRYSREKSYYSKYPKNNNQALFYQPTHSLNTCSLVRWHDHDVWHDPIVLDFRLPTLSKLLHFCNVKVPWVCYEARIAHAILAISSFVAVFLNLERSGLHWHVWLIFGMFSCSKLQRRINGSIFRGSSNSS